MENNPRIGIISPVYTSNRKSALRFESGNKIIKIFPYRKYPSAVAFFMRRNEMINIFGGWSEEYEIAIGEDADLCFKVWKAGFDILIDERVFINYEGKYLTITDRQRHEEILTLGNTLCFEQYKREYKIQFLI